MKAEELAVGRYYSALRSVTKITAMSTEPLVWVEFERYCEFENNFYTSTGASEAGFFASIHEPLFIH